MSEWWTEFYDEHWPATAVPPTSQEVEFIREKLQLTAGDRVFDQCCGIGGLSLELARRGQIVVGLDQSADYVAQAQQAAVGLDCQFVQGDARHYVPPPCQGAVNWHTSFGHCHQDGDNLAILERAFDAMQPGGRLLLDYFNTARLLRHFEPVRQERHVERRSELDFAAGLLRQTWTFTYPDGRQVKRQGDTRLYLPHQLKALLEAAGFGGVELYGDVQGEPFGLESPRLLCLATRA